VEETGLPRSNTDLVCVQLSKSDTLHPIDPVSTSAEASHHPSTILEHISTSLVAKDETVEDDSNKKSLQETFWEGSDEKKFLNSVSDVNDLRGEIFSREEQVRQIQSSKSVPLISVQSVSEESVEENENENTAEEERKDQRETAGSTDPEIYREIVKHTEPIEYTERLEKEEPEDHIQFTEHSKQSEHHTPETIDKTAPMGDTEPEKIVKYLTEPTGHTQIFKQPQQLEHTTSSLARTEQLTPTESVKQRDLVGNLQLLSMTGQIIKQTESIELSDPATGDIEPLEDTKPGSNELGHTYPSEQRESLGLTEQLSEPAIPTEPIVIAVQQGNTQQLSPEESMMHVDPSEHMKPVWQTEPACSDHADTARYVDPIQPAEQGMHTETITCTTSVGYAEQKKAMVHEERVELTEQLQLTEPVKVSTHVLHSESVEQTETANNERKVTTSEAKQADAVHTEAVCTTDLGKHPAQVVLIKPVEVFEPLARVVPETNIEDTIAVKLIKFTESVENIEENRPVSEPFAPVVPEANVKDTIAAKLIKLTESIENLEGQSTEPCRKTSSVVHIEQVIPEKPVVHREILEHKETPNEHTAPIEQSKSMIHSEPIKREEQDIMICLESTGPILSENDTSKVIHSEQGMYEEPERHMRHTEKGACEKLLRHTKSGIHTETMIYSEEVTDEELKPGVTECCEDSELLTRAEQVEGAPTVEYGAPLELEVPVNNAEVMSAVGHVDAVIHDGQSMECSVIQTKTQKLGHSGLLEHTEQFGNSVTSQAQVAEQQSSAVTSSSVTSQAPDFMQQSSAVTSKEQDLEQQSSADISVSHKEISLIQNLQLSNDLTLPLQKDIPLLEDDRLPTQDDMSISHDCILPLHDDIKPPQGAKLVQDDDDMTENRVIRPSNFNTLPSHDITQPRDSVRPLEDDCLPPYGEIITTNDRMQTIYDSPIQPSGNIPEQYDSASQSNDSIPAQHDSVTKPRDGILEPHDSASDTTMPSQLDRVSQSSEAVSIECDSTSDTITAEYDTLSKSSENEAAQRDSVSQLSGNKPEQHDSMSQSSDTMLKQHDSPCATITAEYGSMPQSSEDKPIQPTDKLPPCIDNTGLSCSSKQVPGKDESHPLVGNEYVKCDVTISENSKRQQGGSDSESAHDMTNEYKERHRKRAEITLDADDLHDVRQGMAQQVSDQQITTQHRINQTEVFHHEQHGVRQPGDDLQNVDNFTKEDMDDLHPVKLNMAEQLTEDVVYREKQDATHPPYDGHLEQHVDEESHCVTENITDSDQEKQSLKEDVKQGVKQDLKQDLTDDVKHVKQHLSDTQQLTLNRASHVGEMLEDIEDPVHAVQKSVTSLDSAEAAANKTTPSQKHASSHSCPDGLQSTPEHSYAANQPLAHKQEYSTPEMQHTTLAYKGLLQSTPEWQYLATQKLHSTSGRRQSTPERLQSTPERQQSTPEKQHSTPGKLHSSPERQLSTPERQHSTPIKLHHSTPERQHSTPERQHSTPGKLHSSPERQLSTPERQHSTPIKLHHSTPVRLRSTPERQLSTPEKRASAFPLLDMLSSCAMLHQQTDRSFLHGVSSSSYDENTTVDYPWLDDTDFERMSLPDPNMYHWSNDNNHSRDLSQQHTLVRIDQNPTNRPASSSAGPAIDAQILTSITNTQVQSTEEERQPLIDFYSVVCDGPLAPVCDTPLAREVKIEYMEDNDLSGDTTVLQVHHRQQIQEEEETRGVILVNDRSISFFTFFLFSFNLLLIALWAMNLVI